MSITDNNGSTAIGAGSITVRDATGDLFRVEFEGVWTDRGNGFASFDATVTDASFTPVTLDGSFDGSGGGSFPLAGLTFPDRPLESVWTGAMSMLMPAPQGLFVDSFATVGLADGVLVVPAPQGAVLFGVGGVLVARRRR